MHTVSDMSPLTAQTIAKRADADVKIAEATYVIPAKEESRRTGFVILAVLTLSTIAAFRLDGAHLAWVLGACAVALAGYLVVDGFVKSQAKKAAAAILPTA